MLRTCILLEIMFRNSDTGDKGLKKGLYLVSTPIGNLEDITYRAVDILRKSDYILCEDTRNSKILLKKYDIKCKLISNHKFNEKKNLSRIIELLNNRSIISLISDAGTPSISDPGSKLINECIINKIDIYPIPGPSAVSAGSWLCRAATSAPVGASAAGNRSWRQFAVAVHSPSRCSGALG